MRISTIFLQNRLRPETPQTQQNNKKMLTEVRVSADTNTPAHFKWIISNDWEALVLHESVQSFFFQGKSCIYLSPNRRNFVHYECIGFDLLESILGVLFQLTKEGNFKLVSDKQQLGTKSEGGDEMKRRRHLKYFSMSCLPLSQQLYWYTHRNYGCTHTMVCVCVSSYLMCCLVEELFMWFDSTDLSIVVCLSMFIESILQPTELWGRTEVNTMFGRFFKVFFICWHCQAYALYSEPEDCTTLKQNCLKAVNITIRMYFQYQYVSQCNKCLQNALTVK